MNPEQPNNPLHGVTLKAMLEDLAERHGWDELGRRIKVRCFTHDPSLASSLKFLRKTGWARAEVEKLYLQGQRKDEARRARNRERAGRRAHSAPRSGDAPVRSAPRDTDDTNDTNDTDDTDDTDDQG